MIYIKYKNIGEIDRNALKLIGASTKEGDDTKIGFYGSGIKYALATLLRNNVDVKIFTGVKEIKIGKKTEVLRGQDFEVITIDGEATSITTKMGKSWELWFCLREIIANCIDEGEFTHKIDDKPKGQEGYTNIFIEFNDEIKQIYNDFDNYFAVNRKGIFTNEQGTIYNRKNEEYGIIYRRGIKVGEQKGLAYDYDLKDIPINESRVINGFKALDQTLNIFLRGITEPSIIHNLFTFGKFEGQQMDWDWYNGIAFSEDWVVALRSHIIIPHEKSGYFTDEMSERHLCLSMSLCAELKKQFADRLRVLGFSADKKDFDYFKPIEPTERQLEIVAECKGKIRKIMGTIDDIPVHIGIMEQHVLGRAKNGEMYLNERNFIEGKGHVLRTMIEEYCHIKSGEGDETRSFQDFLINVIATQIE